MPKRQPLRLREFDYTTPGAYFVTVCTHSRACFLGEIADDRMRLSLAGAAVIACWHQIPGHYPEAELDAFIVMPNHVHGIVILDGGAGHARPLQSVIGSFKSAVTKRLGHPVWQRSYHERVIRDEHELAAIRQYVADNPLKWAVDRENPHYLV